MKGLTIPDNVGDEITLETRAVLHFETMHAITYNRVRKMLTNLIVPSGAGYGSKVSGIGELIPLPIQSGLNGLMNYIKKREPGEYKKLQSIASLMSIKMTTNSWGYFDYENLANRPVWDDPGFNNNTKTLTKKAQEILEKNPPVLNLTETEADFRDSILQALEDRKPFPFLPVGQKDAHKQR